MTRRAMLKGSCLCGTVRYEVDRIDMPITGAFVPKNVTP